MSLIVIGEKKSNQNVNKEVIVDRSNFNITKIKGEIFILLCTRFYRVLSSLLEWILGNL